jgi:hypothetical protein
MSKVISIIDCYSCNNKAERRDWCNAVGGVIIQGDIRDDCPLPSGSSNESATIYPKNKNLTDGDFCWDEFDKAWLNETISQRDKRIKELEADVQKFKDSNRYQRGYHDGQIAAGERAEY